MLNKQTLLAALLLGLAAWLFFCTLRHAPMVFMSKADNSNTSQGANTNPHGQSPTTHSAAPMFAAKIIGNKITLSGSVPDQTAKDNIVAKAKEIYGEENVVDELQVSANAPKVAWFGSMGRIFELIRGQVDGGNVSADLNANSVTINGEVTDQQIKDSITREAQTAVGKDVTINNEITVAQKSELQIELDKELEGKTIEFATGSVELSPEGKKLLDELVPFIQKAVDFPILIGGHTDNRGDAKKNLVLSKQRAESVKKYLVSKRIPETQLTADGYGSQQPIADNTTEEGRKKNRRIAFTVKRDNRREK
jgi:OOP family OmpA-OmpF porin